MDLKQSAAIPGALLGALLLGVVGYLLTSPGLAWVPLAALGTMVLMGYLLAHFLVGKAGGEFFRGFLIGANAAANGALGIVVYGRIFGAAAGIGIGVALALALLNLLAVIRVFSNNEFFQGVLGWINFLLPMSWLVTGVGFLLLLFSALGALIFGWGKRGATPDKDPFFKITDAAADWKTGTFFLRGGFVANLNPLTGSAFNMGNFGFAKRDAPASMHIEHEAGHTLNLAAFGSLFHFIGALNENVTGSGANAFAERLAESNEPSSRNSSAILKMWI